MPPSWKAIDPKDLCPVGGDGSQFLASDCTWKTPAGGGGPHAATHATAGSDPVSPQSIGAATASEFDALADLVSDHIAVAATDTELANGLATKADTTHAHAAGDITSGTLAIARIPTGQTGTTVPFGNDARFSDARTPLAHQHNASDVNAGTLNIARIPLGATAATVTVGNDARLSDARTPLAHSHNASDINAGTLPVVRGGTGLAALGTPLHHLRVNAAGNALEYAAESGGGGGALSYQETERTTHLTLTTSFVAGLSLSLDAGTWLVMASFVLENTSATIGEAEARLRNTTDGTTHAIGAVTVDNAVVDLQTVHLHAVIVLAGTKTIAVEARQTAGAIRMNGPGVHSDTATKSSRMTAVKIG